MSLAPPHFLLFSEVASRNDQADWRFVLQSDDGSEKLEVGDVEPEMQGERLELLAVVRGLEALDRPARVTLVTKSRYVRRGLAYGLEEWRGNDWQWERHGEMVPVKNRDLWKRIDRALEFHDVQCRTWRLDPPAVQAVHQGDTLNRAPHPLRAACRTLSKRPTSTAKKRIPRPEPATDLAPKEPPRGLRRNRPAQTLSQARLGIRRRLRNLVESCQMFLRSLGTPFLPPPWLD